MVGDQQQRQDLEKYTEDSGDLSVKNHNVLLTLWKYFVDTLAIMLTHKRQQCQQMSTKKEDVC